MTRLAGGGVTGLSSGREEAWAIPDSSSRPPTAVDCSQAESLDDQQQHHSSSEFGPNHWERVPAAPSTGGSLRPSTASTEQGESYVDREGVASWGETHTILYYNDARLATSTNGEGVSMLENSNEGDWYDDRDDEQEDQEYQHQEHQEHQEEQEGGVYAVSNGPLLIDTQAEIDVLRGDLGLPPSPARVRRMHAASAEFARNSEDDDMVQHDSSSWGHQVAGAEQVGNEGHDEVLIRSAELRELQAVAGGLQLGQIVQDSLVADQLAMATEIQRWVLLSVVSACLAFLKLHWVSLPRRTAELMKMEQSLELHARG